MRLSTKGEYASRAMLELSRRYADGPIHSREISKAQEIPQRFLEQILLLLKRAGLSQEPQGPERRLRPGQAARGHQRGRGHPGHGRPARPHRLRQRHGPRALPHGRALADCAGCGKKSGIRWPGSWKGRPSPTSSRRAAGQSMQRRRRSDGQVRLWRSGMGRRKYEKRVFFLAVVAVRAAS